MFRLGHISDVHLSAVPALRLRDLISKRLVGYANWLRNRAHSMTGDTLARLVADLKAQQPDHIAVTGDLTNIAMHEEFENARRWLEELGPPDRVTAIPGNHDAYVPRRAPPLSHALGAMDAFRRRRIRRQGALPLHAAQGPRRADRRVFGRCLRAVHGDRAGRRPSDRAADAAPQRGARRKVSSGSS